MSNFDISAGLDIAGSGPEKEGGSQVEIIMVQGMADLGPEANAMMAGFIGAKACDPVWKDQESLEAKLGRLAEMVDRAREDGKVVVLVGISAGAGLAELLMLRRGQDSGVRYLYSVGGVLSPNLETIDEGDRQKWGALREGHPAFTSMIEELYERLKDPGAVSRSGMRDRVTAYVSPKDDIVPQEALAPDWVKKKYVNESTHVGSIVGALVDDIKKQTKVLKEAKFG